jgi:hypothetical protein
MKKYISKLLPIWQMQKRQQNDITMQKNETQMTNNMAEKMIRVPSK